MSSRAWTWTWLCATWMERRCLRPQLEERWGGQTAVEVLTALAESRRDLAELDAILGPSQVLQEELVRRTARSRPAE